MAAGGGLAIRCRDRLAPPDLERFDSLARLLPAKGTPEGGGYGQVEVAAPGAPHPIADLGESDVEALLRSFPQRTRLGTDIAAGARAVFRDDRGRPLVIVQDHAPGRVCLSTIDSWRLRSPEPQLYDRYHERQLRWLAGRRLTRSR